ncbi:MAG: hypothetical protein PHW43_06025, partial [Syntrophales bacterium]|nr:hypothetical protein [Syntrophales bacterium]
MAPRHFYLVIFSPGTEIFALHEALRNNSSNDKILKIQGIFQWHISCSTIVKPGGQADMQDINIQGVSK